MGLPNNTKEQTIRGTVIRTVIRTVNETQENHHLLSLMRYTDLDNLVDWFCESVCNYSIGRLQQLVGNEEEAQAIIDFQTCSWKGQEVLRGLIKE